MRSVDSKLSSPIFRRDSWSPERGIGFKNLRQLVSADRSWVIDELRRGLGRDIRSRKGGVGSEI